MDLLQLMQIPPAKWTNENIQDAVEFEINFHEGLMIKPFAEYETGVLKGFRSGLNQALYMVRLKATQIL